MMIMANIQSITTDCPEINSEPEASGHLAVITARVCPAVKLYGIPPAKKITVSTNKQFTLKMNEY
jgi:hypothetical protein